MSDFDKMKEVVGESAKEMGDSVKDGAKLASVAKANEAAYDFITKFATDKLGADEKTMKDPVVRGAVMTMLPLMLHPMATMFEEQIPYSGYVKDYAKLSMTEEARGHSLHVMKFVTELFSTMVFANEANSPAANKVRIDYSGKRVTDLIGIAKQRNIKLPSNSKKNDIIEVLETSDADMAKRLDSTA